jgi:short-subunit dehydrogenase
MAYRVNVIGAVLLAQALRPATRQAGRGTILFTGGSAAVRPNPAIATMSLGKAAFLAATRMLAADVAADGIHVATVVVSGAVRAHTEFDPTGSPLQTDRRLSSWN